MNSKIKISVITSLYRSEKYLKGYFKEVEKITNIGDCEFLLLHNEPTEKELSIIKISIKNKPWFKHIIIKKREGLYSTWNRAILISKGKYCAIWNVDDIRFKNSLLVQSKILDLKQKCAMVFGNLNGTDVYGEKGKKFYEYKTIKNINLEARKLCVLGCFPMWRKSVHKKIGYFDEQFKCVSDFDFQIRLAYNFKLYYVDESLGVYLENNNNKLSSDSIQVYENNLIYLRYGIFGKLILYKIPLSLKRFNQKVIISFNKKHVLNFRIPFNSKQTLLGIMKAFLKIPYYAARDVYHILQ